MKVLIVYAKAGAGHRSAAEAIYNVFKRRGEDKDAVLVDCLDYCSPWFKDFYPNSYIFLVRFLPFVWAGLYYSLENRIFYSLIKPLRRLSNHSVSQGFSEFLKKEKPKVIVSTQFFASEIVAALKKKGEIDSTLISVVTDFGAHTFWESQDVDIFVAASEDTRHDLISRNIPEEKIRVLGIPIESVPKGLNKDEIKTQLGLNKDSFAVLIVGGGFGVGPIRELVFSLDRLNEEIRNRVQLVVVCSRNNALHGEMNALASKLKIDARIFGFVPDLYKMMVASDVIISKSGGLTTSEAMACGLPMIIISPIPGQETKNCDFLVTNGAAIRIDRPGQVKDAIEQLVRSPQKLQQMRQNAAFLSRPNSAEDIVALVNHYLT